MTKIAVISSGKYTSFCNSIGLLQDLSHDLEITIFAPVFNELTDSLDCKSISYYRIPQKPSLDTYSFISDTICSDDCLVIVFSRYLIPDSIHSNFICVNFHPSVLPSFPGLTGYRDSLINRHLGFTAHKIDSSVDQGDRLVSCEITPFPSMIPFDIDMISYRMCSLLSSKIIRLFHVGRLSSTPYSHYSSSTIAGLEQRLK